MTEKTTRCEPADGLRDRDGWHWLQSIPSGQNYVAKWTASDKFWSMGQYVFSSVSKGRTGLKYRYLVPVPSPAEIEALLRCFLPFQMAMAESALLGDDVHDDQVVIHFSGSGASDFVTAGMLRAALAPFLGKETKP